ncbi:glycosyltransferase family 4 protein [Methylocystis heyeri]|uniref:Glycosyltransferase n=1 Tax=Methylocystis heyeri TaxID=391905 RepID=A0A6B8KDC5_9HYPH|nr:glycosyltransferase [Methylocystis heyeri]QGM44433.1 glycosyltransferase [Methylocystis heyeri]
MSAFSCGPGRGSEPGVGWNIAIETARLGHVVHVMTQTECRSEIEREVARGDLPPNLTFDVFMPVWLEALRDRGLKLGLFSTTWHLVNFLWQFSALHRARRLYRSAGFDMVHHVTLAGIRYPTLLGSLGLPTVVGPLGGGERAPFALRKSMPAKEWFTELLRDIHNVMLRFEPLNRSAFKNADLIIVRSEASLLAVPACYRHKAVVDVGMGMGGAPEAAPLRREAGEPLKMLYAGRLVYWKGGHLAIRALAAARSQGADASLDMVGSGPARQDFEDLARSLGVSQYVCFRGEAPRDEVMSLFRRRHAFLFPSLHDAAPTVILEAFASGLPVICLGLGGPAKMVDATCGYVVDVDGRSEEECVRELANAIVSLASNEDLRLAMAEASAQRYSEYKWPTVTAALYAEIEKRVPRASPSAQPEHSRANGSCVLGSNGR